MRISDLVRCRTKSGITVVEPTTLMATLNRMLSARKKGKLRR
jgi:hypothetical protein